jgi:hypothetical protein
VLESLEELTAEALLAVQCPGERQAAPKSAP